MRTTPYDIRLTGTVDGSGLAPLLAEAISAGTSPAPGTEPATAPDDIAVRMADAMIRANARQGGGCTWTDLVDADFTLEEIVEHEPAARRLALAAFVRQHDDGLPARRPPARHVLGESCEVA